MTDDPTTTARLDTTDPDRPRGDVRGLGDARVEELAAWFHERHHRKAFRDFWPCPRPGDCCHEDHAADDVTALAPLVAGWIAEERAGAWDEGYEASTSDTEARSAPPGPNGPVDPTRNPYRGGNA